MPKNAAKQAAKVVKIRAKVRSNIEKMIAKCDKIHMKAKKKQNTNEIQIIIAKKKSLQQLLKKYFNSNNNINNNTSSSSAFSDMQTMNDIKWQLKNLNRISKQNMKQIRLKRKGERKAAKMQRTQAKQERKRAKKMKLQQLNNARIQTLPENLMHFFVNNNNNNNHTNENNNENENENGSKKRMMDNILHLFVDGYNIIGCDSWARKFMRKRGGGGSRKARKRLQYLLEAQFPLRHKIGQYPIQIHLWFDGGRYVHEKKSSASVNEISVHFSGKKSVDDTWVDTFSALGAAQNMNKLCITSDRELTLRLSACGVKVMKSSTFYKLYLKEEQEQEIVSSSAVVFAETVDQQQNNNSSAIMTVEAEAEAEGEGQEGREREERKEGEGGEEGTHDSIMHWNIINNNTNEHDLNDEELDEHLAYLLRKMCAHSDHENDNENNNNNNNNNHNNNSTNSFTDEEVDMDGEESEDEEDFF